MNCIYFACPSCKSFVDCGYRWAYWSLEEPGFVARGKSVDIARVLAASEYWSPPDREQSKWLYEEVFPSVRAFLEAHRQHGIVFWEANDLPETDRLDWLQTGYCAEALPRYFAHILRLRTWAEVERWLEAEQDTRWRIKTREEREAFRAAFEAEARSMVAERPAT
jgi:hypothetical protein